MNILAVDNEAAALRNLSRAIKEAVPQAELYCFSKVSEVVKAVRDEGLRPDVAFLDIEMPGMTGLELASIIKITYAKTNIVFVTGYSEYAMDAIALRPSGYVLKPATKEKIQTEMENLRNMPARTIEKKPIFVQCFGNFEVFNEGAPIQFLRAKSKEMLAYLVDRRGASCTGSEIATALWEDGVYDRSRQKQLSVIRSDLIKSLKNNKIDRMLISSRDSLAVNLDVFDCDYYMALDGDSGAVNSFMGEYMSKYGWAEFTAGSLQNKYQI